MNTKRTYQAIDFAKLFFSICVVLIHTKGLTELIEPDIYWFLEKIIFRVGVPFFFISSGYFVGKKIYNNFENVQLTVKSYIKRLAKPLIFFSIINILLRGVLSLLNGNSILSIVAKSVQSVIFYPYGALWYIQASIIGIIILYYFIVKDKLNLAMLIAFVLYCIGLLANSYYFLLDDLPMLQAIIDLYLKIAVSARNGLFVGFLLLGIGVWISKHIAFKNSQKIKQNSFIWLVLSLILFIAEVNYVQHKNVADGADYFIILPIFAASLFIYLMTLDVRLNTKLSLLARQSSTGIYFLHAPIRDTINIISLLLTYSLPNIMLFCLTLIFSILILLIVYKYRIEPLNKLLS